MPRKKNKRKAAQAAKREAQAKPKRVLMIDPVHAVTQQARLSMIAAAMLNSDKVEAEIEFNT
ncbi:MAG: hypothetical protein ACJAVZ_000072 [Afipia broomeae]|jgi:hypothetical protein